MLKREILENINGLLAFSELLPEESRPEYINQLNKVKTSIFATVITPNPENKSLLTPMENQEINSAFSNKASSKNYNSFIYLTKILIPKLSEKGKKALEEISTPITLYKSLIIINEKSSILDIYYTQAHKYNNYLEFFRIIHELAEKGYLDFIKTDNLNKKEAWVKIGQILEECNIIDETNISRAIAFQQNGKVKYIGEALTELKYINKPFLEDALESQKWLADIIESAIFIEGIINSEKIINRNEKTINETFSDVMDFIVPVLTGSGKHFPGETSFSKPDNDYSDLLKIIDGKSSLLKIYEKNDSPAVGKKFGDKLDFLKQILEFDLQGLITYKKNDKLEKRNAWIKFGELSMNLGLISENQIDETFIYRHRNVNRQIFIGEALVELHFMTREKKIDVLNLQRWCNMVLIKISHEISFITATKTILENNFNFPTEVGKFTRISLNKTFNKDMIYINFQITGKLNGLVYYILDKNLFENLTKNIISSFQMDINKPDENLIAEICNIITGNTLTRLSRLGIFCETKMPEVYVEDKPGFGEKVIISALPLMNRFGRFIIGFVLKS